jgi:murein L,D-transpeptidase YcbB/YkuD
MKNWLLLVVALVTLGLTVGVAAPPKKKATPAKRPAVSASKHTAKQRYAAANSRYKSKRVVARGRARGRGRSPQPVAVQRRSYGQPRPTEDRYLEIEQALASRGYLEREPSSVWTPDCAEALKRFQKDQNLPPNGKLTSLSLIALGLGPKRDTNSVAAAVPNP